MGLVRKCLSWCAGTPRRAVRIVRLAARTQLGGFSQGLGPVVRIGYGIRESGRFSVRPAAATATATFAEASLAQFVLLIDLTASAACTSSPSCP